MSVGASQKYNWGRAIRIRRTTGKCGIQPEVWLTIRISTTNQKCGWAKRSQRNVWQLIGSVADR